MDIKTITKQPILISDTAPMKDALAAMEREHTNTLLVINDEGVLVGEVNVPDFFDAIIPPHVDGDTAIARFGNEESFRNAVREASEIPVSEFMSADYDTVTADASFLSVAAVAISEGRARIAVVDHEDRPIGIISRQGLKQILGRFLEDA